MYAKENTTMDRNALKSITEIEEALLRDGLNTTRSTKGDTIASLLVDIIGREGDAGKQARLIHELAPAYVKLLNIKRKTPRKKNPTPFEWVSYAVDHDTTRPFFSYVRVTTEHIEACDGKRLHRIPNDNGMVPGYYSPNGLLVYAEGKEPFIYPNTDRVIPDRITLDNTGMITVDDLEARPNKGMYGIDRNVIEAIMPAINVPNDRIIFNQKYLADVQSGAKSMRIYYASRDADTFGKTACILEPAGKLAEIGAYAVVMPREDKD